MRIRFWGTRGSIPTSMTTAQLQRKLVTALKQAAGRDLQRAGEIEAVIAGLDFATRHTFGGESACVQLDIGADEYVLCDMGSGSRVFGNHVLAARRGVPAVYHVFISHTHWDHICGFPFFVPAYIPGNTIRIYGCHAWLQESFRRQHGPPSFPVEFDRLGADIQFVTLEPDRPHEVAGLLVTPQRQHHSGDSYGYRFERGGRIVVYSTDAEHKLDDPAATQAVVQFFHDADLVIFDAQYSLAEAFSLKEDWGHSSNVVGVELCQMARARHLCLFHHDPTFDDERLAALLAETRRFEEITRTDHAVHVSAAWDGFEIEL